MDESDRSKRAPEESGQENTKRTKINRREGEAQGEIAKTIDVDQKFAMRDGRMADHVEEMNWENAIDDLRSQKVPLLMVEGSDQDKGVLACQVQNLSGEYYVWTSPVRNQTPSTRRSMNRIGAPGVVIGGTKIWTNCKQIETRLRDEIGMRNWKKAQGLSDATGRRFHEIVEEGILDALNCRESESSCLLVDWDPGEHQPGLLMIKSDESIENV